MADIWIDVRTAAELTGEHERTVRRKADDGTYIAKKVDGAAGQGGVKLQILLSSLPPEAQLKYFEKTSVTAPNSNMRLSDADMLAYKEKFGKEGLNELVFRYELVQKALEIETKFPREKTKLCEQLAEKSGVGKRTLDRWIKAYSEFGTPGIMRKLERASKGKRTSICLEANRFLMDKYLTKIKRKKTVVYDMLLDYAEEKGADACLNCMFNPGTPARCNIELEGFESDVPVCDEEFKNGIKVSKCAQTISRILKEDISKEILEYARIGRKHWEAAYMHKATRAKPDIVNKCWFGDHHVFDLFVYDTEGRIGKPWLTGWYDIASGCQVGWCLSMNPNSRTIAEALVYGILEKPDVPFSGVPEIVYTDNGKDYRSHVFEGGKIIEKDYGKFQYNIETEGLLKQLSIENIHAKPYHGWAKPIERWFRTIEERYIRELPGWCGNHPDERPENFEKELRKLDEQNKLLTLDEFRDLLVNEILPAYHNSEHNGYNGEKPIERYLRLEKARNIKPSWALLSIAKMESKESKVSTQGIEFNKRLYWHKELKHLAQEWVKIKYNRERKDVIIVMHKNKFVCAATVKESFNMVQEEEERIANHIAEQKRQELEVKQRIAELTGRRMPKARKTASAKVLTGDFNRESENCLTVLEYEKAMKAYKSAGETKEANTENKTKKRFEKTGEMILSRTVNGT